MRYITAALLVTLWFSADLYAQRITYESLRMRDRQPNVFVDHLPIPDADSDDIILVSTFRIEHNFLGFRRSRSNDRRDQTLQFSSDPTVRISIREASRPPRGEAPGGSSTRRREERPNGGTTVATGTWSETVYAETFEQTQSSGLFVQNMIKTSLAPGRYDIETTVTADNRTRRNHVPGFRIPDSTENGIAYFYFIDDPSEVTEPYDAPLINMGRSVYFGRDHQLAIWMPEFSDDTGYKLEINQLRIQQRDTTDQGLVWEHTISNDKILSGYQPNVYMSDGRPQFSLMKSGNGVSQGAFYVVHIPNSTFKNAHFRIRLMKATEDDKEEILAVRVYQSLWLDMPVSLYNLDVAVNMMRFIADNETLRSLRRGSRQARENRFHEFWDQRDPTPENEYNELMVEYFRRIDYAFEHFTTPQNPGYDSDQGKVYITNGEPDRRERTYPPNQAARELWYYGSRTFVFEATSGFGDYRLLDRK